MRYEPEIDLPMPCCSPSNAAPWVLALRVNWLCDTPRIETHLVRSTPSPGGVGEPGTPPIAPAVAPEVTNALFVLMGKRLRELPLRL